MNDLGVIDRFLDTFARYIDSGFGLLQPEVAYAEGAAASGASGAASVGAGLAGVARSGASAAGDAVRSTARRVFGGGSAGTGSEAGGGAPAGSAASDGQPPAWARKLRRGETMRRGVDTAAHTLASGDSGGSGPSPERLQFRYAISGSNPPWKPVSAFDDGQKVYIQFPAGIAQGELPPLFVVGPTGESQLVNARFRAPYYVVDRLFGAAELRLGEDKQQIVRIERTDGRRRGWFGS